MKKKFSCNGSIDRDKETNGIVLKLQGDQRENIQNFLIQKYEMMEDNIIIHGI